MKYKPRLRGVTGSPPRVPQADVRSRHATTPKKGGDIHGKEESEEESEEDEEIKKAQIVHIPFMEFKEPRVGGVSYV